MPRFLDSLPRALRRQVERTAALREEDPDRYRRWMRGEVDRDGTPLPRNPQLVEQINARIAATRRPAIAALATEVATKSRLGGLPHLPEAIAWPSHDGQPMALLAQVDVGELPRGAASDWLPSSGMLFFFAGRREGGEWADDAGCVLFAEQASPVARSAPAATPIGNVSHLAFQPVDTFAPLTADDDAGQWQDNNDLFDWSQSLLPFDRAPSWQIDGWPHPPWQHDLALAALTKQAMDVRGMSATDWKLIGQFDLHPLFGETSGYTRGYFLVSAADARQARFDRAVLLGQPG